VINDTDDDMPAALTRIAGQADPTGKMSGYPAAIVLIVASAIASYLLFRYKGWL